MEKTFTKVYAVLAIMLVSTLGFSQGIVKGIAWDGDMKEAMVGANVVVKGTMNGVTTNFDGSFELSVPAGDAVIEFSFMGYKTEEVPVTVKDGGTVSMGRITMESDAVGLQEIQLVADVAIARKTPVAVSTVSAQKIQQELGSQEFPEIMKTTPGVYATKQGGGIGDSRINIRGFSQENIAVMINGIPVNDMENGKVYWSNWAGLSDATRSVQVQRGLGASKLAVNSVGGTMNILTQPSEAKSGGFFEASITNYGMYKNKIGLSTGLMKSGTAVTVVLSTTQGNGYVEQTWAKAYSYFVTASQKIGENHTLLFTASGAPQVHGQRPGGKYSMLSYDDFEKYDRKRNINWGYTSQTQLLNEKENFYHKPQIGLNWIWHIDDNQSLTTSIYASFGTGGGSGILGIDDWTYNVPRANFDDDGQLDPNGDSRQDYATVIEKNRKLAGEGKKAKMILRNSMNNHRWFGVLSTYKNQIGENLHLLAGVDARTYEGTHYREVRDLLGASGWDDAYAPYKSGNPNAQVGDKIDYYNVGKVSYGGLFSQLEYSTEELSVFATASVSNTWYGRTDYFNYATVEDAEGVDRLGYNFKFGANYNLNENNNVYANLGYYSRAPFIDAVYINYGNNINPDLTNETIMAGEVGYGYRNENMVLKVNAYYTKWGNRYMSAGYDYQDQNGEWKSATANFTDLAQTHIGVEVEANYKVTTYLNLGAFASFGGWEYSNDPVTDILDAQDPNIIIAKGVIVALDGIKVADAPQTMFGLTARVTPVEGLFISANWNYNANLYANFDVENRIVNGGAKPDREQSYKIPAFNTLDMTVGYNFDIQGLDLYAGINGYNLFDSYYMAEGVDGSNHSEEKFVGFMGWGRNFNFTVRVSF
jgi:hypothetical protein